VIDRISKGRNVTRLLYYLYGPGKSDEHENPHLVAGWRDPITDLEPPIKPDGQRDFRRLSGLLNAPLDAIGRRGRPGTVWHCVLSAAPTDRPLSDAEWNAIGTEFMHQMGLARRDDPAGVRWVTVRHGLSTGGIDHIHIVATLARQDGRVPNVHNDFLRARQASRAVERQFGLTITAPADRTAAVRPTRAETERSARTGGAEPERITLRRLVQDAAAVAASEADFFARLRDNGALIRERRSDADPGRITGYAVALPGHLTRPGEPVWFSGGRLAPDLTLPKLRRRWERPGNAEHHGVQHTQDLSARSVRAALRSAAASAADHARDETMFFARLTEAGVLVRYRYSDQNPGEVTGYALTLPGHRDARSELIWYGGGRLSDDLTLPRVRRRWQTGGRAVPSVPDLGERRAIWDDVIRLTGDTARQLRSLTGTRSQATSDVAAATADALRISARVIKGAPGRDLRRAADDFGRAAREAYTAIPRPTPPGDAVRTTARLLSVLQAVSGRQALGLAALVVNLAELVMAGAELRAEQGRAHQAAAALSAAERLRYLARHSRSTSAPVATAALDQGAPFANARDSFPPATVRPQPPSRPKAPRPGRPPPSGRRTPLRQRATSWEGPLPGWYRQRSLAPRGVPHSRSLRTSCTDDRNS